MKKAAKPRPVNGDFSSVAGRNAADVFLRTVQQHHVQVSVMADVKANIIITASSIVLTLALNRFNEPGYRHSVMVLVPFLTLALLCAIVAVLPKHRPLAWPEGAPKPPMFNLLFFGHFANLPKRRFLAEMERAINNDADLYRTSVEDIYGIGFYLNNFKYRYLRWSYAFFLAGFLLAALLAAGEMLL
jgi:hypothetical protein